MNVALAPTTITPFFDAVESGFYSYVVECLLRRYLADPHATTAAVELGSGTGAPVIDAITKAEFCGHIQGWDLNPEAVAASNANAAAAGVQAHYAVSHGDFFELGAHNDESCVIANPPYLPSFTGDIADPGLWGGPDGNEVALRVLSLDFEIVTLIVSSLSDPAAILRHAMSHGYRVVDWAVRPVPMGRFSQEPAVYRRIAELQHAGRAHLRDAVYTIAGVTWLSDRGCDGCDEAELVLHALTATDGARRVGASISCAPHT
jgi:methylase of polypeptide subunit release factors